MCDKMRGCRENERSGWKEGSPRMFVPRAHVHTRSSSVCFVTLQHVCLSLWRAWASQRSSACTNALRVRMCFLKLGCAMQQNVHAHMIRHTTHSLLLHTPHITSRNSINGTFYTAHTSAAHLSCELYKRPGKNERQR